MKELSRAGNACADIHPINAYDNTRSTLRNDHAWPGIRAVHAGHALPVPHKTEERSHVQVVRHEADANAWRTRPAPDLRYRKLAAAASSVRGSQHQPALGLQQLHERRYAEAARNLAAAVPAQGSTLARLHEQRYADAARHVASGGQRGSVSGARYEGVHPSWWPMAPQASAASAGGRVGTVVPAAIADPATAVIGGRQRTASRSAVPQSKPVKAPDEWRAGTSGRMSQADAASASLMQRALGLLRSVWGKLRQIFSRRPAESEAVILTRHRASEPQWNARTRTGSGTGVYLSAPLLSTRNIAQASAPHQRFLGSTSSDHQWDPMPQPRLSEREQARLVMAQAVHIGSDAVAEPDESVGNGK